MTYPTVTVWTGGQLVGVTSLPQFNHTTGPITGSVQITNNSDISLIFILERSAPVTILPRYRLTAPADPNSQYSLSLAPSQTGSADKTQYVTLTESPDAVAFVLEPLNNNVNVTGGSVTITGTTDVNVANTPAVTISGTPVVNVGNTPSVNVSGGTISASITAGTVDIQNVANGIISAAGSLRYLGHQSLGASATYTITALERALVIFTPTGTILGGLTVASLSLGIYALNVANPVETGVYIAYVNSAIDTHWIVTFGTSAGTSQGYVCADTGLPITDIARSGQQLGKDSIPVVIASDQPTQWSPAYSYTAHGSGSISLPNATGKAWFVITGDGSTLVRIHRIRISQTTLATAPGSAFMSLWDISADGSGGVTAPRNNLTRGGPVATATARYVTNSVLTTEPTYNTRMVDFALPIYSAYPFGEAVEIIFGTSPGEQCPTSQYGFALEFVYGYGVTGTPGFLPEIEWSEG